MNKKEHAGKSTSSWFEITNVTLGELEVFSSNLVQRVLKEAKRKSDFIDELFDYYWFDGSAEPSDIEIDFINNYGERAFNILRSMSIDNILDVLEVLPELWDTTVEGANSILSKDEALLETPILILPYSFSIKGKELNSQIFIIPSATFKCVAINKGKQLNVNSTYTSSLRGFTYAEDSKIYIILDESSSTDSVLQTISHELVHVSNFHARGVLSHMYGWDEDAVVEEYFSHLSTELLAKIFYPMFKNIDVVVSHRASNVPKSYTTRWGDNLYNYELCLPPLVSISIGDKSWKLDY